MNEGLLSQRSLSDALAICIKIVGHFKHSQLNYSRLEDVQVEVNMCLQQDVHMRWNSTFYMIDSLTAQKAALCAYTVEYDLTATLTTNQWGLLEKIIAAAAPFEEVSSLSASVSDVIPIVSALKGILTQEHEDDRIKSMKVTVVEAVKKTRLPSPVVTAV